MLIGGAFTSVASANTIKERIDSRLADGDDTTHPAVVVADSRWQSQLRTMAPAAVSDDAPQLYGWMSHSDAWDKNRTDNYGIYSFPAKANTSFSKEMTTCNASAAANADGRLCGFYVLNYMGTIVSRYYAFDADNGNKIAEAQFNKSNTSDIYTQYAYTMAYNRLDGKLYAECFRMINDTDLVVCLSTIDQLTGVATEVVRVSSGNVIFVALTFDSNGTLYGVGDDGALYTISLTDGSVALIGSTGVVCATDPQSMWYHADNGKIYWTYLSKDLASGLYEINPATGSAALVSDFAATSWFVGLYSDSKFNSDVPADIDGLKVDWTAQASLDGTVTFTAPATTTGGASISGNLDVELYIDYARVENAPATVAAGAEYTYTTGFTVGTHTVEAVVKNDAGISRRARLHTYAGTDRPGPVGDLKFTLSGRTASLSWSAPVLGENGGWFDASALCYKIVRRPDNKVVATAHTSTSFTDEIPDELGNWFYEITSVGTSAGATVETERILYGTAKSVPFKETFDTDAPLDLMTFEDVNADGYFWKWKDGSMVDVRGDADEAGDWMFTAPVALTTDYIYKLTIKAHAIGSFYNETFNLAIGTEPASAAMTVVGDGTVNGQAWKEYEALVEISANGNYYIGIQHSTPGGTFYRDELYVDDIELVPFISTKTPASVGDLTVTHSDDDAFKADISFTVPDKAINGSAIDRVTKVEIYNNGTLVETVTGVSVGEKVTRTLTLTQGNNLINVVAYNDEGRGHDTTLDVFGGVDVPGIVNNLRYEWDADDDLKATIRWDAPDPFGVNGMPVPESAITYSILTPFWGSFIPSASGLKVCEYAVTASSSTQALAQRGVQAVTVGGSGTPAVIMVNLGTPIATPVAESFANGAVTNANLWSTSRISGSALWGMYISKPGKVEAEDGDNGLAGCVVDAEGAEGGECRLVSPAYDFSSTLPMNMTLWVLHNPSAASGTNVQVEYTVNGCDYIAAGEPIAVSEGEAGWRKHTVSLAGAAGHRKAMLGFRATLAGAGESVYIDNVTVESGQSGIDGIVGNDDCVVVKAVAGGVEVTGAAGAMVRAYAADGRLVAETTLDSNVALVALPAGIYVVKVAGKSAKVAVK